MTRLRRVLLAIFIIFIIYAIINEPTQSANVTNNAWDQIKAGLSSINTFFSALVAGN